MIISALIFVAHSGIFSSQSYDFVEFMLHSKCKAKSTFQHRD